MNREGAFVLGAVASWAVAVAQSVSRLVSRAAIEGIDMPPSGG